MAAESASNLVVEIGHVLFIDLVGYSKLRTEEQNDRLRRLTEIVVASAQVRKATDEQLVRLPTGDGMALVFRRSAEEPAHCALEITRALKHDPELPIRMGIHSGPVSDVTDVGGRTNLAGGGINIAQRVMDCGDAGHILFSKRAAEDLEQSGQWQAQLHDLGECEVKHGVRLGLVNFYGDDAGNPQLPTKIRALRKRKRMRWALSAGALLCIAAAAAAFVLSTRKLRNPATPVPEKSIAVLPFENRSSDKENAYFAEGVQDEILTHLAKIADLKVISRTSTQHYQSAPQNLPDVARELGVAHILEGSVQKNGDAIRVNVQLIKAANDSHLWGDTFDRKLTDIFSVESEVAKTIAEQLRAKLTGREEQLLAARPTDNSEAYDAYLRGLSYTLKSANTAANSLGALKYLKEAVDQDPRFAVAWALLSVVEARGYLTATLQPTNALRNEARRAAETALTLQPNLGEAVHAKGYYHYSCLKDYSTAVHYFEQARQLLPNSSRIPESLAYLERRQGEWELSESYFNEAERLDPLNVNLLSQHAISYISLRRFSEALQKLDHVLAITPDDPNTIGEKAGILQAEGDLVGAATLLAPLHAVANDARVLEAQVYQAILERRTEPIIPQLNEILAKPDPALGFINGELRFWLGWAQQIAGHGAAAHETWRQADSELESFLKDQPENDRLIGYLALTKLSLGETGAAAGLAARAMAVVPMEKDAMYGPSAIEILARVNAQAGEADRAIAALQKLLSIPASARFRVRVPLTPALLRLDPMFDPLRNDPRFQKLCQDPTAVREQPRT
jgi:TolB-like protein/Tfp pilus assembly protein PilF